MKQNMYKIPKEHFRQAKIEPKEGLVVSFTLEGKAIMAVVTKVKKYYVIATITK